MFLPPAHHVLGAEAVLMAVGVSVALWRRRWNLVGVTFFAALLAAAVSYLALAGYVTVTGGLSIPATMASVLVLLLEAAALAGGVVRLLATSPAGRASTALAVPDPGHLPFVSLHVAAYNEPPDMLIETIQSLEAIDYPHFEVVVIDNTRG